MVAPVFLFHDGEIPEQFSLSVISWNVLLQASDEFMVMHCIFFIFLYTAHPMWIWVKWLLSLCKVPPQTPLQPTGRTLHLPYRSWGIPPRWAGNGSCLCPRAQRLCTCWWRCRPCWCARHSPGSGGWTLQREEPRALCGLGKSYLPRGLKGGLGRWPHLQNSIRPYN